MKNQKAIMETIVNKLIDYAKIEKVAKEDRKTWIGKQLTNKTEFSKMATRFAITIHG